MRRLTRFEREIAKALPGALRDLHCSQRSIRDAENALAALEQQRRQRHAKRRLAQQPSTRA